MTTERDLQRLDINRKVRDDADRAGIVTGYRGADGVGVYPVRGDQTFPFFKDPPDNTLPASWRAAADGQDAPSTPTPNVLPQAAALADLELLEPISTLGYRTLNLVIEFYPIGALLAEQQLYVVPYAGFDLPQNMARLDESRRVWAPIASADALQGVSGAPFSLNPPCMAFRYAYGTQFTVRGIESAAFDPADRCALVLTLDVTNYNLVRLGLGASNATSTAGVLYMLGR